MPCFYDKNASSVNKGTKFLVIKAHEKYIEERITYTHKGEFSVIFFPIFPIFPISVMLNMPFSNIHNL